jgi:hypothetical protein
MVKIHVVMNELDILVKQAKVLIKEKKFDLAFQELERASWVCYSIKNRREYLKNMQIVLDLKADVCYSNPLPNYMEFISNSFACFMIHVCHIAGALPAYPQFFRIKKSAKNGDYFNIDKKELDSALNNLGALSKKEYLLNNIYKFTFGELPIIIGIPESYIIENSGIGILDFTPQPTEFKMQFEVKPFEELPVIFSFIDNLLDKTIN